MMTSFISTTWFRVALVIAMLGLLLVQITSYRNANQELSAEISLTHNNIIRMSQSIETAKNNGTVELEDDLLWQESETASAEQRLQTWALDALQQNNQSIRQYIRVARPTDVDATTIGLRIEFSGTLKGTTRFLAQVETNRPALAISNLQIRPVPERDQTDGTTLVSSQVVIWGGVEVATD